MTSDISGKQGRGKITKVFGYQNKEFGYQNKEFGLYLKSDVKQLKDFKQSN